MYRKPCMVSQSWRRMAKLRTNSLEKGWSAQQRHRSALVWLGQSCWSRWANKRPPSRVQVGNRQSAVVAQVCSGIQGSMGMGDLQAMQGLQRTWQICVDTGAIGRLCAGCRGLWLLCREFCREVHQPRLQGARGLTSRLCWGRLSWLSSRTPTPAHTGDRRSASSSCPGPPALWGSAFMLTQQHWNEFSPVLTELLVKVHLELRDKLLSDTAVKPKCHLSSGIFSE